MPASIDRARILVQVTINRRLSKPTIYRNLYENTGPGSGLQKSLLHVVAKRSVYMLRLVNNYNILFIVRYEI